LPGIEKITSEDIRDCNPPLEDDEPLPGAQASAQQELLNGRLPMIRDGPPAHDPGSPFNGSLADVPGLPLEDDEPLLGAQASVQQELGHGCLPMIRDGSPAHVRGSPRYGSDNDPGSANPNIVDFQLGYQDEAKQIKRLKKKLKEIERLEDKKQDRRTLSSEEEEKISKKQEYNQMIAELEIKDRIRYHSG